jgi:hypothetical protein
MTTKDYTTSFTVDQSAEEVFDAINNVRAWWSEEIEGDTDRLGTEFQFHPKDAHRITQKITEFVPGKKVVGTSSMARSTSSRTKRNGTARKSSSRSPRKASD